MSQKLRKRWIVSLVLPEKDRQILLTRFPPAHPLVYCERLTIMYGVSQGVDVPFTQPLVLVHSYLRNDRCDAFFCEVSGQNWQVQRHGEEFRRRFHITISTVEGVSPSIAGLPARMGGLDGLVLEPLNPVHGMTLEPTWSHVRKSEPRVILG